MLEGIANNIIESTKLNDELKQDLDKLSLINKFDLALFLKTSQKLNREDNRVRDIIQLTGNRNKTTHPKSIKTNIDSAEYHEKTDNINFKTQKSFPIKEDPITISKKVFNFLDYYLIDLCKCDIDFLSSLLLNSVKLSDKEYGILQLKQLPEYKKAIEYDLQIKINFLFFLENRNLKVFYRKIK
ncbi:MAG: hypothetical protein ABIA74_04905 [bacterium]